MNRRTPLGLLLAALLAAPAAADYEAGVYASDIGDYTTAFAEFARAAAQGDLRAANELGQLYERGDGVERDPARAAEWYRRAAEAGNREAQYNLAGMYRSGDGLPLDEQISMQWYLRAARQGLPIAQFFVAKNYEHGQGAAQDVAEAWAWYSLAAAAGDDGSARNRDRVANYLGDAQRQRAVTLLRDHALELALTPSALRELGVTPPQAGADTGAGGVGRDTVSAIQVALAKLGYEVGAVDGLAGPRTRQALTEFAASVGMEGDPRIGAELLEQLRAAESARRMAASELGSSGSDPQPPMSSARDTVQTTAAERTAAGVTVIEADTPADPVAPDAPVPDAPLATVPAAAGSAQPSAPPPVADVAQPAPSSQPLIEGLRAFGYPSPPDEQAAQTALAVFARDAGVAMDHPDRDRLLLAAMDALARRVADAPAGKELVRAVQIELARLGHDPGPADGLPGARTRAAIAGFASAAGYPALPEPTPVLLARLRGAERDGAPPPWSRPFSGEAPSATAVAAPRGDNAIPPPADAAAKTPTGVALVRAVQTRLLALGYEPGPVDGAVGVRTRRAAAAFRADRGLPGGVAIDVSLFEQLQAVRPRETPVTPASAPAAVAEPIREAQRLLAALGFDVGEADGIAGPRTRAAVRAFALAHGQADSPAIDASLVARLRDAAGETAVAPGSSALREAQQRLLAHGYRPGNVDGLMDTRTREQIAAFQRAGALAVSGELDEATRTLLGRAPAPLDAGVGLLREVQDALARRGFDPGPVDGAMGPRTRAAIRRFREAEGLPADGGLDAALVRRLGLAADG